MEDFFIILSSLMNKFNFASISDKGLLSVYASIFAYLYSSFDELIAIYTIFIVIDYALGIILAIRNKSFTRQKGINGAINKILCFSIIVVAMLLDYMINFLSCNYGMVLEIQYIRMLTVIFMIVNEGTSINRNLKELKIEIPFYIKMAFDFLKNIKNINKKNI